ncbi:hypothetical protein [Enterocloster clostridioformis]|uniref:Uncharacterized protein n=1 Tax=Enterocloster clostridioformis TaxID=1531 RepID=A0A2X2USA8_9FIRM|nr:hypothetical protein [Enterocloster clostridioformis]MCA5576441.1 hypothetical protein [Enterocloster clostridioformis]SQB14735.1 Uncharacterised protein [Enterocloster clostridioformis]
MRRISKAFLEQERDEAGLVISRSFLYPDKFTEQQIRLMTFYFARLEQILSYIDEKTDSIPPLI